MRVLVTGAGGFVAGGIVRKLREQYELRLLDVEPSEEFEDLEWVVGSITNPSLLERAMADVGAVVNSVRAPKSEDRHATTNMMFDYNVKGLYLLLDCANRAGIRRFVHVSSTAHIIGNWYDGRQITIDSPYTTRGRYSLSKMLQEQICEHMARNTDMTIVALRLWQPCEELMRPDERGQLERTGYTPGLIDTGDFGEAVRLAIERESLSGYEVFHCVATEEARARFDAERTERILGFRAEEDFSDLARQ